MCSKIWSKCWQIDFSFHSRATSKVIKVLKELLESGQLLFEVLQCLQHYPFDHSQFLNDSLTRCDIVCCFVPGNDSRFEVFKDRAQFNFRLSLFNTLTLTSSSCACTTGIISISSLRVTFCHSRWPAQLSWLACLSWVDPTWMPWRLWLILKRDWTPSSLRLCDPSWDLNLPGWMNQGTFSLAYLYFQELVIQATKTNSLLKSLFLCRLCFYSGINSCWPKSSHRLTLMQLPRPRNPFFPTLISFLLFEFTTLLQLLLHRQL